MTATEIQTLVARECINFIHGGVIKMEDVAALSRAVATAITTAENTNAET